MTSSYSGALALKNFLGESMWSISQHSLCRKARNRNRILAALLAIAIIELVSVPFINAQSQPVFPTNYISYATATPSFGVGHDYIQMMNETVDPGSGQVSMRIKIPTPKGRGLDFPFGLNYNSSGAYGLQMATADPYNALTSPVFLGPTSWGGASGGVFVWGDDKGGWTEQYPKASYSNLSYIDPQFQYTCYYSGNVSFSDLNGEREWLGFMWTQGDTAGGVYCPMNSNTQTVVSQDMKYQAVAYPGFVGIAGADGKTYLFAAGSSNPSSQSGTYFVVPDLIEDRNGNKISIAQTTNSVNVTDSLGRLILSENNANSGPTSITTTYAVAGTPAPYIATWSSVQATSSPSFPFSVLSSDITGGYCSSQGRVGGSVRTLTNLELPDGTSYHFDYDPVYGLLSKITYPNGAYVAYSWTIPGFNDDANYTWVSYADSNVTGATAYTVHQCSVQYGRPQINSRTVSYDGVNIALQQTFSYSTVFKSISEGRYQGNNYTSKTTTVATSDLIRNTSYTKVYTYIPNGNSASNVSIPGNYSMQLYSYMSDWPAVEQSVVTKDSNGIVLSTEGKTWLDPSHLLVERTALPDDSGKVSEIHYSYDSAGRLLSEMDEYDYGTGAVGPLLRKTVHSYQQFGASPVLSYYFSNPSMPFTSTLLAFPSATIVSNGSGTVVAETDYSYDQTAVSSVSAVQHDDTFYGASSTSSRANLTKVSKRCLQNCTDSVTTYTYDETGQVTSMTDPCGNGTCSDMSGGGHTTYYSYADNFASGTGQPNGATNAYITAITGPPVNGVNFVKTIQYGYNDGKIRTMTDENNQSTTFCYFVGGCGGSSQDPWVRLTQVNYPDGGRSSASYADTGTNPSTTISSAINGGMTKTSTTILDAMGRPIQTQLTSDSYGTDYSNTLYDGEGHVYQQSNPTRCSSTPGTMPNSCSESTWGIITLSYDALGRKKQQINQDGSSTSWLYSGNTIQFTDERNNSWSRTSNALGWLTNVVEPGALNTLYSYDALGNLLCADQWGTGTPGAACTSSRYRSFSYDSLSRLKASHNPETGTIQYTYDLNSNISSKTDARSVMVSYTYDNHNRLKWKQSPSGSAGFGYDGKDESGNAMNPVPSYPVGRLTHASNEVNAAENYAYDTMGRVVQEAYCTPQDCSYGNVVHAAYDLAGNLSSLTYPDGRTISHTFDGANRISSINYDNWNGTYVGTRYFTANSYDPVGHLISANRGNSIIEGSTFNSRLEIMSKGYISQSCVRNVCMVGDVWDRLYTWQPNGNLQQTQNLISGTTRQYSYDALNRITGALDVVSGTQTPDPNGINESFNYDIFGNLWESGNFTFWPSQYSAANQPGPGWSYDAAGNLLSDSLGNSYTWDAEERILTANGIGYTYSAGGERVGKPGTDTLYFNGQPLARLSGGAWTDLVYGTEGILAEIPGTQAGSPQFRITDHLGSSVGMLSSSGAVLGLQDYAPFGQLFNGSGISDPYKFTGKERDAESGNDYFEARYYSSSMGRFLSPDWSARAEPVPYAKLDNPQSLNLYAYMTNNPLVGVDLDGHWGCNGSTDGLCDPAIQNAMRNGKSAFLAMIEAEQQNKNSTSAHFEYSISTGELWKVDASGNATFVSSGYSGKGNGLNNPYDQDIQGEKGKADAGPIPAGNYTIGKMFDNTGKTGPGSMRLTPGAGNEMNGRSGFLIHGDNRKHDFSASEGCIILSQSARNAISLSGITRLEVNANIW